MGKLLSAELYKIREKILRFVPVIIGFGVAAMAFCIMKNSHMIYVGVSMVLAVLGIIFCGITGFFISQDFSPVKYILFSFIFAGVMITLGYAIFKKADLK